MSCQKIRGDVLRLHVIANSDSEVDQSLKLKVRDRILSETGDLFLTSTSYEGAVELTNEILPQIISFAEDEIRANGFDYTVQAKLDYTDFDTRHYEEYTLPAGEYLALNVTIGEGQGRNWWCVMFPSVCVGAAAGMLTDTISQESANYAQNSGKYVLKFKTVEIFEKIKKII